MTDTPTTSETILASATAETDPKALSNAAVTEDVLPPGAALQDPSKGEVLPSSSDDGGVKCRPETEVPAALGDLSDFPQFLHENTKDSGGEPAADHETRLQRLEDELAFLRKMFGWPEHTH